MGERPYKIRNPICLPALLWLLPFAAFRLAGGRLSIGGYMLRFGIAFIPIMASAHAIKAIVKMVSRIPYWQYAVSDPLGIKSAQGIVNGNYKLAPPPTWADPVVTAVSFLLMGTGIVLSFIVLRKSIAKHIPASGISSAALYLIPALYGGGFIVMLVAWRLL